MDELISESMATEEQRSAKKEEKATNDLAMATEIITLGFNYWKNLLETALSQKLLTGPEQAILRQAMQIHQALAPELSFLENHLTYIRFGNLVEIIYL